MEHLETISKLAFAGLAIWRLTRTVHASGAAGQPGGLSSNPISLQPGESLTGRATDFLYWICIWMSAQTTLWVVCGFSGVLINWLAFAGVARLFHSSEVLPRAAATYRDSSPIDVPVREGCSGASELCR